MEFGWLYVVGLPLVGTPRRGGERRPYTQFKASWIKPLHLYHFFVSFGGGFT